MSSPSLWVPITREKVARGEVGAFIHSGSNSARRGWRGAGTRRPDRLVPPLPAVVLGSIAFPLQLKASAFGAWPLEARNIPVVLAGNVIRLPRQDLFVTEACSGLRSLTALLSLGVVIGGTMLAHPLTRLGLLASVVPIALGINAIRVFLTGYAVYFFGPDAGAGVMHWTEGWLLFVVALLLLGAVAKGARMIESAAGGARDD